MGTSGAGVIFDAIRKIKENRALRTSNRNKFNGNFSGDTILKSSNRDKIEFPALPEQQVKEERERIRLRHLYRKRNRIWILSIAAAIVLIAIGFLWVKTDGFEYWEFLNYSSED